MRDGVKNILLITCWILLIAQTCDSPALAQDDDLGLWLARSCVGEAGWEAWETKECAAIMHVYQKRAAIANKSTYQILRKYSAAVKPRANRHNKWVLHLNREGTKPKYWPPKASWSQFREAWGYTLAEADLFVSGSVEDPLPEAVHYGCQKDAYRAKAAGWYRLKSDFRNRFYSIKKPQKE